MTIDEKKALAQAVIDADSACPEFKEAAQNYLKAIGTDDEKLAAKTLVEEAAEDIQPIGNSLAFFASDRGREFFGEELQAQMVEKAKEVIAAGGQYCFCPGCMAAKALIDARDEFIG